MTAVAGFAEAAAVEALAVSRACVVADHIGAGRTRIARRALTDAKHTRGSSADAVAGAVLGRRALLVGAVIPDTTRVAVADACGRVAHAVQRAAGRTGNAHLAAVIAKVLAMLTVALALTADAVAGAILGAILGDGLGVELRAVKAHVLVCAFALAFSCADTTVVALVGALLDVARLALESRGAHALAGHA